MKEQFQEKDNMIQQLEEALSKERQKSKEDRKGND